MPPELSQAEDFARARLFRPDKFFWTPWTGEGEVRRPNGALIGRYRIEGHGHADRRAGHMAQTITHDSGAVQRFEWEVLEDDPESYVARDRISGVTARGRADGPNFVWSFWSRQATPLGALPMKTTVTYALETDTTAVGVGVARVFGVIPVAIATTRYRQLGSEARSANQN